MTTHLRRLFEYIKDYLLPGSAIAAGLVVANRWGDFVFGLYGQFEWQWIAELTAVSGWWPGFVLTLFLLLLIFFARERALKEQTRPKLGLIYKQEEPWVHKLPTSNIPDPNRPNVILHEPSWWFRVELINTGPLRIAHGCRVFLRSVEFSADQTGMAFQQTQFGDSLRLRWAQTGPNEAFASRDIGQGERNFVDVFSTDPVYNAILVKWEQDWIANEKLFSQHGLYRLILIVNSEDAGSDKVALIVRWNGQWDDVNVAMEAANP